jgi:ribosomal protein S18 acetylase RimI-like enzyme
MPASAAPVLRAVQAADAAVLAALHAQAMDEAWSAATFAGLLAVPGSFGLLAMGAGDPAGFALARVAADEAEILALAVVPAWRCRGVGAALVDATAAAASSRSERARPITPVPARRRLTPWCWRSRSIPRKTGMRSSRLWQETRATINRLST